MAALSSSSRTLRLLLCFLFLSIHGRIIPHVASLSFSYDLSDPKTLALPDLNYAGNAKPNTDRIELTKNDAGTTMTYSTGRVSYAQPMPLWDAATGKVASFITTFGFAIVSNPGTVPADGLAFFLGAFPASIPPASDGGGLGLFNKSGAATADAANKTVAVEFDTFKNPWDASSDHIGIDINSANSTEYKVLPAGALSRQRATMIQAQISYDNSTSVMTVLLVFGGGTSYKLSAPVDLKSLLPEEVAVGFSASTGSGTELHQLMGRWSFSSTLEAKNSPPSSTATAPALATGPGQSQADGSPAITTSTSASAPEAPSSSSSSSAARRRIVIGVSTGASAALLCAISALVLWRRPPTWAMPNLGAVITSNSVGVEIRRPEPGSGGSRLGLQFDSNDPAGAMINNFLAAEPKEQEGGRVQQRPESERSGGQRTRYNNRDPAGATDNFLEAEPKEQESRGRVQRLESEMGVGPRRYEYRELAGATDKFAEGRKLGRGGSRPVYRGYLSDPDDRAVAVKVFPAMESSTEQGRKELEEEIKTIAWLRHRNLVQLLGWCDSREGLFLVYELVPEGSLDKHLYSTGGLLAWPQRYNILLGVGSALQYLHTELEQPVVHGNIKPSNILLDSSQNAKIGDFWLARLSNHEIGKSKARRAPGYTDPSLADSREPSAESDVYSFGVVMLEIACGKRPEAASESPPGKKQVASFRLVKWVWDLYCKDSVLDAADARLRGEFEEWQMRRALVIGLWCAHPDRGARPTSIAQAVRALQSEDAGSLVPVLVPPEAGKGGAGHATDEEHGGGGESPLRRYEYRELVGATDKFAEGRRLGRGGSRPVYRGYLSDPDDYAVAVKVFPAMKSSGEKERREVEEEVKIIAWLRHRNLVQLLGCCDSREGLFLVYELVPEGSLDKHLYSTGRLLTWPQRYNIILGLGSALHYLHAELEQRVVHGNIKPSNILLDSSQNAKLGDFWLARLADQGTGESKARRAPGYTDPSLADSREPSAESDVYSFGVVALEIACGKRPEAPSESPPGKKQAAPFRLVKWVWDLYCKDSVLHAADARLQGEFEEWQMRRALVVGLWCAHPDRGARPASIAQAVRALQSEDAGSLVPVLVPPELRKADEEHGGGGESPAPAAASSGVPSWSSGYTSRSPDLSTAMLLGSKRK